MLKLMEAGKTRTAVGQALHVMGDAVEQLEAIYEASQGEVTAETEQAEAFAEMATAEAFEALARFDRWCGHSLVAVKAERERLDEVEKRIASRRTWCHDRLREALEREGKMSWSAGPFQVRSTAGRWRVEADADLEQEAIAAMPETCREWVPPADGKWRIDKRAAELELRSGFPIAGLRRVQGTRAIKVV